MNRLAKTLLMGLPWALLAGCGGSGSSNGSSIAPVVAPPADITSQNAPAIAGAVVQAALGGGGLGSFAGLGSGAGSVLADPGSQLLSRLGGIQKSQTESLQAKAQSGELQALIPETMSPCINSGSVTVSGNIANPTTLSPGDTINLAFSLCDDGAGVVNGTYAMRITGFTGDLISGSFSFGVTVTLTGFQVTDAGETVTANGDISINLDTSTMPTLTVSVTANSLSMSTGTSSETLTNFSVTESVDELTFAYTMDASGTLTSSAFTGSVTFSTAASLQGDAVGYAFSGELTITGAGSASIRVMVLDGVFIRLEIDLDGDGDADEFVDTTWDEVFA